MGGILRAMRLAVGILDSRLRGNDGAGGDSCFYLVPKFISARFYSSDNLLSANC